MSLAMHSENTYIQYWLKQLSAEEQEALESLYFSDADAFDSLLAAKQQLIERYCRQQLTPTERQTLEAHFQVCADCRTDVQLMKGLFAQSPDIKKTEAQAPTPTSVSAGWWRWFWPVANEPAWGRLALAAASLLLCLGIGGWLYSRSGGSTEYLLALAPEAQAGTRRGDASAVPVPIRLDSSVAQVRLQLALPAKDALLYQIEIKNLESKETVWQKTETLSAANHEVLIPRSVLPAGDYRISLFDAVASVQGRALSSYRFDIRDK